MFLHYFKLLLFSHWVKTMHISKKYLILPIAILSIIFLHCTSSKNNLPQDTVSTDENWVAPQRLEPPPSPGTVKAIAEIVDILHESKQSLVTVRIQKVLDYGSATPLLSSGREIKTVLSPSLQKEIKASDSNPLIQGHTVTITLQSLQQIASEEKHSSWRIIQIHK
jgi:hypothetical protein